METIYLGAGCFWCTEAVFKSLKGVSEVLPGYMGGTVPNPTYEDVCSGNTGHAEVAKVTYDTEVMPTENLLKVFFDSHDPTTLNRQGADEGTQYRSAIFYTNDDQKKVADSLVKLSGKDIVTEIIPAEEFYLAENYHHDYYERNKDKAYCQIVIAPKIEKLEKNHSDLLKK